MRRVALQLVNARALGESPLTGVELEPGSYLLTVEAAAAIRFAIRSWPGAGPASDSSIDLPAVAQVPAGYAYIPPGPFLFGSAADEEVRRGFFSATPIHERQTAGFLMGLHEVTYADWIAYVDQLSEMERRQRELRMEAHVSGKGGLRLDRGADGVWTLHYQPMGHDYTARWGQPFRYNARKRRASQDWGLLPVTGVTVADAEAYASWLDRTRKVPGARLCTEAEWERGSRGADGRIYPAGNVLSPEDANVDETYGKDQNAMGPDQVGSYPHSNSPFGLADMSGNVFEWTTSVLVPGNYVVRGGATSTTSRPRNWPIATRRSRAPRCERGLSCVRTPGNRTLRKNEGSSFLSQEKQ